MHTVYHYTDTATCKRDFGPAAWGECKAWIASSADPKAYYMRAAR